MKFSLPPSLHSSYFRRTVVVLVALLPVLLVSTPVVDAASRSLEGKIGATRERLERQQGRARVLTSDVARYSARVRELEGQVGVLRTREQDAEEDLATSTGALRRAQAALRSQRRRLVRLRARLRTSRRVLAARLVELYQADKPDLVGVVLNSNGFTDLVERAEFLATIHRQDTRVMTAVSTARSEAAGAERALARTERQRSASTQRIRARRDEIATVRARMERSRASVVSVRNQRARILRGVRLRSRELRGDLEAMQRQQARVRATLMRAAARAQAAGPGAAPDPGPVKRGSGALIWPVNGQLTSPFGPRWGRLHAGIDIAVPTGTPVRAALAGTVTIAAVVGAYGNYVCVSHAGGLSTCYAHNSRLNVRPGQRVDQGDVIAAAGNTGISTGPHLHFETRMNGTPRDPMGYL
jgi:murein DD-endopeptidase MepM/ murein hydrolase activator NlpD